MSKIKEHYHEEINSGIHNHEKDFLIDCMKEISNATALMNDGTISIDDWFKVVMAAVIDFDNMHSPCLPK